MPDKDLTNDTITTTLIVGAGTMGHAFAQLLAMNKIRVYLVDQTKDLFELEYYRTPVYIGRLPDL